MPCFKPKNKSEKRKGKRDGVEEEQKSATVPPVNEKDVE